MERTKKKDGSTILATGLSLIQIIGTIYPVGTIYMTTNPANPSTYWGGTWAAWGVGKVPVGVDTGQTEFDTVEETGGSKTNTLVSGNLPPHQHTIVHTHDMSHTHSNPSSSSAGTAAFIVRGLTANSLGNVAATNPFSGDTGTASPNQSGVGPGTSVPVNNLQPYITCYMWKRTA